jgi:hypothetical protein
MKTIQTKSGELILIKVPDNAYNFRLYGDKEGIDDILMWDIEYDYNLHGVWLEKSRCEIVGKFSELEDKIFDEFVDYSTDTPFSRVNGGLYCDYEAAKNGTKYYMCITAKESFQSLCKSQGIEDDLSNYLIIKKV